MRVFIGIEFDNEVKEYLYKIQNYLKPSIINGELTNFNNFHLTSIYIGNVTDDEIDIIKDCMFLAFDSIKPFDIKLNGLHSFNKGRTSIFWVGIDSGKEQVKKVYKNIVNELMSEEFNVDFSKKYRPHITIGKKMIVGLGRMMDVMPYYPEPVRVSAITLFQSHRVNDVLTYTPIHRVDL